MKVVGEVGGREEFVCVGIVCCTSPVYACMYMYMYSTMLCLTTLVCICIVWYS